MEATSNFLQGMFHWKVFTQSENDVYLMIDEQPVMNVSQRNAEMEKEGMPSHIRNYITVDDYDESLNLALDKGAALIHEAVVADFCKLGVLRIPGDLFLSIIQYFRGHP
jgi:predicted enzyme related to lactoylglutathione lyase